MKGKYKFTKRIISILLLIQLSLITNKEISINLEIRDEEVSLLGESNSDERHPDLSDMAKVNLGIFDSQECLLDSAKAKNLLETKGMGGKSIDENTRFILGNCNPVLMTPGLYSTRLMLTIDCKNFSSQKENLFNLRLFCGDSICKTDGYEEHVLWPALFDSPFELYVSSESNYSSCFGYFFKFHKLGECPKVDKDVKQNFFYKETKEEPICLEDKFVKITFYGGTPQTQSKSQCGLSSIKNIVSKGSKPINESWINNGAPRVFEDMYNRYYEMGYRPGFSIAGIPYDFRRFVSTNEVFKEIFKNQIERLFANTGKPVIIIAHSYGCLNTLNSLVKSDKEILKKIKKFIAVGPPFAGAPKGLELFLHGSSEFNTKFTFQRFDILNVKLDEFGQRLALPLTPVGYELRPNPILFKLFNDEKYKDFKSALVERFSLEKECRIKDCDKDYIKKNSYLFSKLFENIPNFDDSECLITDLLNSEKYKSLINQYKKETQLDVPHFLPCRHDLYNTVNCPMIKFRLNETEDFNIIELKHCHDKYLESSDLFNHLCDKTKNCLDTFFNKFYPYPFLDEKMINIIDRFFKKYSRDFPEVQINSSSFFDSKEMLKKKIEKMISYQGSISNIKDFELPPVDTMIIFGSYLPTNTAYLFDEKKNEKIFDKLDVLTKGGDGTVPSWSSYLIGLKWLFDKKNSGSNLKINLVEYCSTLSNSKQFGFDPNDKDKDYFAISCDCLDSDNFYNFKTTTSGKCEHSTMISDSKLIKFLESYIFDAKENTLYPTEKLPNSLVEAITNYKSYFKYEENCSEVLSKIVKEGL
jgi:hypothetical protein